jgi:hypothetical protein
MCNRISIIVEKNATNAMFDEIWHCENRMDFIKFPQIKMRGFFCDFIHRNTGPRGIDF